MLILLFAFAHGAGADDLVIGQSGPATRVPKPLRQGEFLPPQSIAAVEISPDNRQVAVATMAFRHDHNFWLLGDDGRVLWGRYLDPWAPWQVAFSTQGKRLAVGLAYSRFTMPNPTFAFFDGEKDVPIYASDADWESAWMRYGSGPWRTGWMPSLLGDMLVATDHGLFTAPLLLDEKATGKPGDWRRDFGLRQRAWRMTARSGGSLLVCGLLAADNRRTQVQGIPSLESTGVTVAAIDSASGQVRWKAAPIAPAPEVPLPPEPTHEFRPLADDFHLRPSAMVPFRAAMSAAVTRDGNRVACTEYGGHARIGQQRIHPNWSPRHPIWFCPGQRGWLRVFGDGGEELARSEPAALGCRPMSRPTGSSCSICPRGSGRSLGGSRTPCATSPSNPVVNGCWLHAGTESCT
ncbi:MAG: hypothetical protein NUV77_20010 [Thermoguttaceae bacterium]|nr:hypothetical protein [Thermoguttaceae bacterium]